MRRSAVLSALRGGSRRPPVKKYFAHPAVEDRDGVIPAWYRGQNGQCDFRVRIAAETLKRYPWTDKSVAVMAAPYFVFSGSWGIKPDGTILVSPKLDDWMNADVGQRSVSTLSAEVAYYRYTGNPAAIGLIALTADYLLDYVDSTGHPWRPATEFIMRRGTMVDLVPTSFWTEPQLHDVAGTSDPELYRYGVYGRDFTAYFTVAPGQTYHVRLKFCQAAKAGPARRLCDHYPDWRQAGRRRYGHRRHGRGPGQGVRPGRQRRPAATRRDRDPLPRRRFRRGHDPGRRSRAGQRAPPVRNWTAPLWRSGLAVTTVIATLE